MDLSSREIFFIICAITNIEIFVLGQESEIAKVNKILEKLPSVEIHINEIVEDENGDYFRRNGVDIDALHAKLKKLREKPSTVKVNKDTQSNTIINGKSISYDKDEEKLTGNYTSRKINNNNARRQIIEMTENAANETETTKFVFNPMYENIKEHIGSLQEIEAQFTAAHGEYENANMNLGDDDPDLKSQDRPNHRQRGTTRPNYGLHPNKGVQTNDTTESFSLDINGNSTVVTKYTNNSTIDSRRAGSIIFPKNTRTLFPTTTTNSFSNFEVPNSPNFVGPHDYDYDTISGALRSGRTRFDDQSLTGTGPNGIGAPMAMGAGAMNQMGRGQMGPDGPGGFNRGVPSMGQGGKMGMQPRAPSYSGMQPGMPGMGPYVPMRMGQRSPMGQNFPMSRSEGNQMAVGEDGLMGMGSMGPNPISGQNGPMGQVGQNVPMGPNGSMGPNEPMNPYRPMGPHWPIGPNGPMGPDGPMGPNRPMGPDGPMVTDEPMGPGGPMGPNGPMDSYGPMGQNGPMGPGGPMSLNRPMGPGGPNGPNGPMGLGGPVGPNGPMGPIGWMGPNGPMGPNSQLGFGPENPMGMGRDAIMDMGPNGQEKGLIELVPPNRYGMGMGNGGNYPTNMVQSDPMGQNGMGGQEPNLPGFLLPTYGPGGPDYGPEGPDYGPGGPDYGPGGPDFGPAESNGLGSGPPVPNNPGFAPGPHKIGGTLRPGFGPGVPEKPAYGPGGPNRPQLGPRGPNIPPYIPKFGPGGQIRPNKAEFRPSWPNNPLLGQGGPNRPENIPRGENGPGFGPGNQNRVDYGPAGPSRPDLGLEKDIRPDLPDDDQVAPDARVPEGPGPGGLGRKEPSKHEHGEWPSAEILKPPVDHPTTFGLGSNRPEFGPGGANMPEFGPQGQGFVPGRQNYPGYGPGGQNYPGNGPGGQNYPGNGPGGQNYPGNGPGGQNYPGNGPGGQNYPGNGPGGQNYPGNGPGGQNYPGNGPGGQNYPGNGPGGQNYPGNGPGGQNYPGNGPGGQNYPGNGPGGQNYPGNGPGGQNYPGNGPGGQNYPGNGPGGQNYPGNGPGGQNYPGNGPGGQKYPGNGPGRQYYSVSTPGSQNPPGHGLDGPYYPNNVKDVSGPEGQNHEPGGPNNPVNEPEGQNFGPGGLNYPANRPEGQNYEPGGQNYPGYGPDGQNIGPGGQIYPANGPRGQNILDKLKDFPSQVVLAPPGRQETNGSSSTVSNIIPTGPYDEPINLTALHIPTMTNSSSTSTTATKKIPDFMPKKNDGAFKMNFSDPDMPILDYPEMIGHETKSIILSTTTTTMSPEKKLAMIQTNISKNYNHEGPISFDARTNMALNGNGMLTEGVRQFCKIMLQKPDDDAMTIYKQFTGIAREYHNKDKLFRFGNPAHDEFLKLLMHEGLQPLDILQEKCAKAERYLGRDRKALSKDVNAILVFADRIYNKEENDGVLHALDVINNYPNETGRYRFSPPVKIFDACLNFIEFLVMKPLRRIRGGVKELILIESVNRVLSQFLYGDLSHVVTPHPLTLREGKRNETRNDTRRSFKYNNTKLDKRLQYINKVRQLLVANNNTGNILNLTDPSRRTMYEIALSESANEDDYKNYNYDDMLGPGPENNEGAQNDYFQESDEDITEKPEAANDKNMLYNEESALSQENEKQKDWKNLDKPIILPPKNKLKTTKRPNILTGNLYEEPRHRSTISHRKKHTTISIDVDYSFKVDLEEPRNIYKAERGYKKNIDSGSLVKKIHGNKPNSKLNRNKHIEGPAKKIQTPGLGKIGKKTHMNFQNTPQEKDDQMMYEKETSLRENKANKIGGKVPVTIQDLYELNFGQYDDIDKKTAPPDTKNMNDEKKYDKKHVLHQQHEVKKKKYFEIGKPFKTLKEKLHDKIKVPYDPWNPKIISGTKADDTNPYFYDSNDIIKDTHKQNYKGHRGQEQASVPEQEKKEEAKLNNNLEQPNDFHIPRTEDAVNVPPFYDVPDLDYYGRQNDYGMNMGTTEINKLKEHQSLRDNILTNNGQVMNVKTKHHKNKHNKLPPFKDKINQEMTNDFQQHKSKHSQLTPFEGQINQEMTNYFQHHKIKHNIITPYDGKLNQVNHFQNNTSFHLIKNNGKHVIDQNFNEGKEKNVNIEKEIKKALHRAVELHDQMKNAEAKPVEISKLSNEFDSTRHHKGKHKSPNYHKTKKKIHKLQNELSKEIKKHERQDKTLRHLKHDHPKIYKKYIKKHNLHDENIRNLYKHHNYEKFLHHQAHHRTANEAERPGHTKHKHKHHKHHKNHKTRHHKHRHSIRRASNDSDDIYNIFNGMFSKQKKDSILEEIKTPIIIESMETDINKRYNINQRGKFHKRRMTKIKPVKTRHNFVKRKQKIDGIMVTRVTRSGKKRYDVVKRPENDEGKGEDINKLRNKEKYKKLISRFKNVDRIKTDLSDIQADSFSIYSHCSSEGSSGNFHKTRTTYNESTSSEESYLESGNNKKRSRHSEGLAIPVPSVGIGTIPTQKKLSTTIRLLTTHTMKQFSSKDFPSMTNQQFKGLHKHHNMLRNKPYKDGKVAISSTFEVKKIKTLKTNRPFAADYINELNNLDGDTTTSKFDTFKAKHMVRFKGDNFPSMTNQQFKGLHKHHNMLRIKPYKDDKDAISGSFEIKKMQTLKTNRPFTADNMNELNNLDADTTTSKFDSFKAKHMIRFKDDNFNFKLVTSGIGTLPLLTRKRTYSLTTHEDVESTTSKFDLFKSKHMLGIRTKNKNIFLRLRGRDEPKVTEDKETDLEIDPFKDFIRFENDYYVYDLYRRRGDYNKTKDIQHKNLKNTTSNVQNSKKIDDIVDQSHERKELAIIALHKDRNMELSNNFKNKNISKISSETDEEPILKERIYKHLGYDSNPFPNTTDLESLRRKNNERSLADEVKNNPKLMKAFDKKLSPESKKISIREESKEEDQEGLLRNNLDKFVK